MTANKQWLSLLRKVLFTGAASAPRGQPIVELIGHQSVIDMRYPFVTIPDRKMSQTFLYSEAAWVLSGSQSIADAPRQWLNYTDSGSVLQGAYGPKILEQRWYVIEKLLEDTDTRQAVIDIWRPMPRASKDIPCTLSMQFIIRGKKLHCVVTMRSSDLWLGWPYDVFVFTCVAKSILLQYNCAVSNKQVSIGALFINHGSLHLYQKQADLAQNCLLLGKQEDILFDTNHLIYPDDLQRYLDMKRNCVK